MKTGKVQLVVRFYYFLLRLKPSEMFFVNYFERGELVRKLLIDAEIDVKNVFRTVRSVRDSTQLGLNLKRRVFQHLTKVLNIGMLEIMNNLRLDL